MIKRVQKQPRKPQTDSQNVNRNGTESGIRNELKTNLDKATFIVENGYSKRSITTLERLNVKELDFIIENKRDPESNEISKKTIEASKEITKGYISILESIKETRANEPLNKGVKAMLEKNDTALSEYVGTSTQGKISIGIYVISAVLLLIDSLIGFDKIKGFVSKEKAKDDKGKKDDETK